MFETSVAKRNMSSIIHARFTIAKDAAERMVLGGFSASAQTDLAAFETLKPDRRNVYRFTLDCKLRILGLAGGAMPNGLYGRFHLGRHSPVDGAVSRFRTNFVVFRSTV